MFVGIIYTICCCCDDVIVAGAVVFSSLAFCLASVIVFAVAAVFAIAAVTVYVTADSVFAIVVVDVVIVIASLHCPQRFISLERPRSPSPALCVQKHVLNLLPKSTSTLITVSRVR